MDRKNHWARVYETKASDQFSWFQEEPSTSLALLDRIGVTPAT
jgi:hypothetical protein